MKFSVIIPTYNRCATLMETLSAIEFQTFSKNEFEVIVVDDGSADGTRVAVENFLKKNLFNIKYFFRQHEGPAQARNFGIDNSRGEIILFCGDDTIPDSRLIENHNVVYQREKEDKMAVLGIALWDKTVLIGDFMRFVASAGPQFHFNNIKNINNVGWDHFYTCNISIPRSVIGDLRFDVNYPYAAFEDIDFGWLLARRGLKLFFNRQAIVHHKHFYEPASLYQRMFLIGKSFVIFSHRYQKNKFDQWRLKIKYAPFDFFFGTGLVIFNFFSRQLAGWAWLKKNNQRWHWFFNVCYYYSSGMKEQYAINKKL
ncbi:MAG: glycosyltransferase family 2 protein [Patescibacteria group bacterium]|nr:glycosyltransferase family 2 protein [Patescibacteria group bacterium]